MRKQPVTIVIEGARMTEQKQQQVGQAIMIRLIQLLDGETDDVTITFKEMHHELPRHYGTV